MRLRVLKRPWSDLIRKTKQGESHEAHPGKKLCIGQGDSAIVAADTEPALYGEREGIAPLGKVSCSTDGSSKLFRIPLPIRPTEGCMLRLGETEPIWITWQDAPDRPPDESDPADPKQHGGRELRAMVDRMNARMKDIEREIENAAPPNEIWDRVIERWWTEDSKYRPTFDVIVKHATTLDRIVVEVLQHLRQVLVRTHRMTLVSRIQEMDRRSMLWLARQPGNTIEERAGPLQRLLAPARLQSVDTPENRVLHALARQSRNVARSYRHRNRDASGSPSLAAVQHYERVCRRVDRTLQERDVGLAPPGLPPNHALQHNVRYRRIWRAWQEILRRQRIQDEMWRWQARSWEELCVVALVLVCAALPSARLVAGSPVHFHHEHVKGKWLLHDDPLAVFHLSSHRLMVEVTTGCPEYPPDATPTGVSAWLKITNYAGEFQRWIAMWSLQSFSPGPLEDELDGIGVALRRIATHLPVTGGIVLRSRFGNGSTNRNMQCVSGGRRLLALELGLAPEEFTQGLNDLEDHLHTSLKYSVQ